MVVRRNDKAQHNRIARLIRAGKLRLKSRGWLLVAVAV